jgi:hypothetical protein
MTTGALAAFEHAAYYGNKDAQFEIHDAFERLRKNSN